MAETKVPAIKNIPAQVDRETGLALESMKEALEVRLGRRGDPKDRAITLRELIDSGLATDLAQSPYNPNTGATGFGPIGEKPGDVTVPPAPTVLTASGLFTDVLLSWNQSTNTAPYGNHAFTEIWRSQAEDLSSAVLVGTTNAFIYTDKGLEYDSTYYYWVRFISTTNIPGPWSNMASATTVENIAATMAALSETLSGLPGYSLLALNSGVANIIKQSSSPSTRTDGSAIGTHDIWFDTDDSQVYTRNAANNAWVAGRDATLVSLYGSTSYTGSTITAAMATAQSNIITVTNANSATSSSLTTLSAYVGSGDDNSGTAYSASNTILSHVNATDANAAAAYVLKVEANGAVAGMVLEANASDSGTGSAIQFQADKFAIWDGSGAAGSNSVAPFIVDSGVVYIDTARIKDATILDAKIGTLHGGKIIADTITATQIDADTITATEIAADTITADQIDSNTITANEIAAETITGTEINVDTLAVKKFADVETKIISHRADAAEVPLQVTGENSSWSGTYPGSTIVSVETSSVVNFGVTITNVRNGAGYRVIYSAVLGDVRNGTIQYSFDNSNFTSLSPLINADSGTYRSYVYVWDGNISGLSSTQSTVYWRINWNVTGGQVNSTYAALYVTMDNTQGT